MRVFFLLICSLLPFPSQSAVKGVVDWAKSYSGEFYVSGWACNVGYDQPTRIHVYVEGDDGSREFVKKYETGLYSEAAVGDICKSNSHNHRFKIPFTLEEQQKYLNKRIYVFGLSTNGGGNPLLTNSGKFKFSYQDDNFTDKTIFRRTFDPKPSVIWAEDYLKVVSEDNNNILRASYIPYDRGSKRILKRFFFGSTKKDATLEYDVKFDNDFEFVNGGKLHGLAGGTATTGCARLDPKGWSVRVMWNSNGAPFLYVYDQDRTSRCGKGLSRSTKPNFEKGKWHRVSLYIKLNSTATANDGIASLSIDGQEISYHDNLRLSGDENIEIDSFLFSTFHGGASKAYSPSKIVHAYFDNFSVTHGFRNLGALGQLCELKFGGISQEGSCCSESCGSCGGAGCGGLFGGSSACCTGNIQNSAEFCIQKGKAPCQF